jgi:hypothetical protein
MPVQKSMIICTFSFFSNLPFALCNYDNWQRANRNNAAYLSVFFCLLAMRQAVQISIVICTAL